MPTTLKPIPEDPHDKIDSSIQLFRGEVMVDAQFIIKMYSKEAIDYKKGHR